MRIHAPVLAAAATSLALSLACAGTASATCYSSTPASQSFPDSVVDGESGLAPEIGSIDISVDGGCHVTAGATIVNRPSSLIQDDGVIVYLDTDGNPATGDTIMGGADKAVGFLGMTGPDAPPLLGTWNGSSMVFTGGRTLTATGLAAFTDTVDGLGIAPGTNLGVGAGASWTGINSYFDFAPNDLRSLPRMPVNYSTAAPAPAPTPIAATTVASAPAAAIVPRAPVAKAPSVTVPSTSRAAKTCAIPLVKRKTLVSAKKSIGKATCVIGSVRAVYSNAVKVGHVVRTAPAGGGVTARPLTVYVSRGKRHARRRAALVDNGAYLTAVAAAMDRAR